MSATAAPTSAATLSASGGAAGGLLAPGTYLLEITEANGIGETAARPECSSFKFTQQANPSHTAAGAGSGSSESLQAGSYKASYTYVDAVSGGPPRAPARGPRSRSARTTC
jgi:hypothetical protein